MENKRALVAQLRQYRMENRLGVPTVAKRLRVTNCTIYLWESGKRQPSDINIYHIKKLLRGG